MKKEQLVSGWSREILFKYSDATGASLDTFVMNGSNKKHVQMVNDAIRTKTPIKYKYNEDEIL